MVEPITLVGWISLAMLATAGPVGLWRGIQASLRGWAIRKDLESALRSRFRPAMEGEVLEADVKGLPARVRLTELTPDRFRGEFSYAVSLSPPIEFETSYELPVLTPPAALPKIAAAVPGLGPDQTLRGRPEEAVRAALLKLEALRGLEKTGVSLMGVSVRGGRLRLEVYVELGERPVERLLEALSAGAEVAFRLMA